MAQLQQKQARINDLLLCRLQLVKTYDFDTSTRCGAYIINIQTVIIRTLLLPTLKTICDFKYWITIILY